MTVYEIGSNLGQCPECGSVVKYIGENRAECSACKSLYDVDLEEGEQVQDEAPAQEQQVDEPVVVEGESIEVVQHDEPEKVFDNPEVAAPQPIPNVVEGPTAIEPPDVKINPDDVGKLVAANPSDIKDRSGTLQLDAGAVEEKAGSDIPDHVKRSRPWRWAHAMSKTGNPYRSGSKNWHVFQIYVEKPRTLAECIVACEGNTVLNEKLSYVLTAHEVTIHCLMSGLLVIDETTRRISICQGKPIPKKVM